MLHSTEPPSEHPVKTINLMLGNTRGCKTHPLSATLTQPGPDYLRLPRYACASHAARYSPESYPIRVMAQCQDVHVAITVADQGTGITQRSRRALLRLKTNRLSHTQPAPLPLAYDPAPYRNRPALGPSITTTGYVVGFRGAIGGYGR